MQVLPDTLLVVHPDGALAYASSHASMYVGRSVEKLVEQTSDSLLGG